MITYRSDVDGLRAVAVLSVVAFHAFPGLAPGGYIGVDIFFVISGYLITRLIAADVERGRFSIASFYVRRTKRILPALFAVLVTTLVLCLYLLTPGELRALGRTMAATAAFVSNVAFWQDSGYFDAASESKPLLHTWSLAVEEQFYLVWPLAFVVLQRLRRPRAVVIVAMALSFLLSSYLTVRHQPSAFYLLPSRAWELLLGAAMAMGVMPDFSDRRSRDVAGLAGLSLIVGALLWLDSTSPFPGWNALPPCIGAALIIAAGHRGGHVVADSLLGRRPFVFVGLISYSLYLWHWPLLSLARITQRGHLSAGTGLLVVAVAVVLSVLTWRFVETPLRAKGSTPAAAPVLVRYALVSLALLAVGMGVHADNWLQMYSGPEILRTEAARNDINPMSGACLRWQAVTGPLPMMECMAGEPQQRRLVLWGDSHADAVAPAFVSLATERGYTLHQLTMAGCPPLSAAEVRGPGAEYRPCTDFNRQVMDYVTADPRVEAVVLSARWTLYTENIRFGDDPGPITYLVDDRERELSTTSSRRVFGRSLDHTVSSLRRAGKAVFILGTIPPMGINVPNCLARNQMPLSGVRSCDVDAASVLAHLDWSDRTIERVAREHNGVCAQFPSRVLCRDGRCLASAGPAILYANDDHVSVQGALFLARHLEVDSCGEARELLPALRRRPLNDASVTVVGGPRP